MCTHACVCVTIIIIEKGAKNLRVQERDMKGIRREVTGKVRRNKGEMI